MEVSLTRIDEDDPHRVASIALPPTRVLEDMETMSSWLKPMMESDIAPVLGRFVRMMDEISGSSKVITDDTLVRCSPVVSTASRLGKAPEGSFMIIAVDATQAELSIRVFESLAPTEGSMEPPKLVPERVKLILPVVGRLPTIHELTNGLSKVIAVVNVPRCSMTVEAARKQMNAPVAVFARADESEDHLAASAAVPCILWQPVLEAVPIPHPTIVIVEDPVEGRLVVGSGEESATAL